MSPCGELKNGLEKNIVKSVKRTAITERAICETIRAVKFTVPLVCAGGDETLAEWDTQTRLSSVPF